MKNNKKQKETISIFNLTFPTLNFLKCRRLTLKSLEYFILNT